MQMNYTMFTIQWYQTRNRLKHNSQRRKTANSYLIISGKARVVPDRRQTNVNSARPILVQCMTHISAIALYILNHMFVKLEFIAIMTPTFSLPNNGLNYFKTFDKYDESLLADRLSNTFVHGFYIFHISLIDLSIFLTFCIALANSFDKLCVAIHKDIIWIRIFVAL